MYFQICKFFNPYYLVFFLLQGSLSLFKSSLKLLLLHLQSVSLLVEGVDGAPSVSQLVLNLICQVLVLSLDHIQLLGQLVIGSPQAEHLQVVVKTLGPARLQLDHNVFGLYLPFSEDLIEVSTSLL